MRWVVEVDEDEERLVEDALTVYLLSVLNGRLASTAALPPEKRTPNTSPLTTPTPLILWWRSTLLSGGRTISSPGRYVEVVFAGEELVVVVVEEEEDEVPLDSAFSDLCSALGELSIALSRWKEPSFASPLCSRLALLFVSATFSRWLIDACRRSGAATSAVVESGCCCWCCCIVFISLPPLHD